MAIEQTFVAEYRVEAQEVIPLIPALEALAAPDVQSTRWWKLLVPDEPEPAHVTCQAQLAQAWCRLGGVAAHWDEQRVRYRRVEPVKADAWHGSVKAWANDEGLSWGSTEGHVEAYGTGIVVKTPSRLGPGEHVRRRRAVESILQVHELDYSVECITQHSDNVCRPLFADDQERLFVEPVTVAVNGGGA